jgi:23S rRNA (adenine-N6)-dimethyltransferase
VAGRRPSGARPPADSQHFLRDNSLAAQLVRDAGVGERDLVLDIGAGSGRLTAELARVARQVVAIEVDPRWASSLRNRWSNVEVNAADVLEVQLPDEEFRVVANVPFDQTTSILHKLLDDPSTPLARADLVVEWGVAMQLGLPWPSRARSVLWASNYEIVVTRRLPRHAFNPPPRVDAGVVSFRRRMTPLIPLRSHESFCAFVTLGFRKGLRSAAPPQAIHHIAGPGATGRDLDAHQWAQLFLASNARRRWED